MNYNIQFRSYHPYLYINNSYLQNERFSIKFEFNHLNYEPF